MQGRRVVSFPSSPTNNGLDPLYSRCSWVYAHGDRWHHVAVLFVLCFAILFKVKSEHLMIFALYFDVVYAIIVFLGQLREFLS